MQYRDKIYKDHSGCIHQVKLKLNDPSETKATIMSQKRNLETSLSSN